MFVQLTLCKSISRANRDILNRQSFILLVVVSHTLVGAFLRVNGLGLVIVSRVLTMVWFSSGFMLPLGMQLHSKGYKII